MTGRHDAPMEKLAVRNEEKDEVKRMEVEQQKTVSRMIKSADGSTGIFAQNYQANGVGGGGGQVLKNEDRTPRRTHIFLSC